MDDPIPTGPRPRRARLVALAASAALLLSGGWPAPVSADPVDDKRREAEAIADELERLEEDMRRMAEDYAEAVQEQEDLGVEISAAEQEVGETEAELAEVQGTLYTAAVVQFMGGGRTTTLTQLLATDGGIQDTLQREQFTAVAINTGTMTTDELDALVGDLAKKRRQLEKQREYAERTAQYALGRQQDAEELAARYEERRRSVQGELASLVAAERSRRADSARSEAERIANENSGRYDRDRARYGSIPSVSARSQTAVNAALSQLGVPYRYATSRPGVGFDCSGLTAYAWGRAGVSLPRNSRAQYASIRKIPRDAAAPGDLIFYYSPISHVSLYLGGGRVVHAPQPGSSVEIASVRWDKVVGVGRPG
jgi:cell wall-associated NlpC family hydrolase